ncbi:MAG: MoxR family ATPase [Tissierellia bacterium]|nr:MoxR family ATPase [Tissierellia bacterium]
MKRSALLAQIQEQGVDESLLRAVEAWQGEEVHGDRIPQSHYVYDGREVWEEVLHAILGGYHLLLSGAKASGKNVLSENLAQLFRRPMWNLSLNISSDAQELIGQDTFVAGEVRLRKGPLALAAEAGGFVVLDEINMAKNESLAVIHAALDFRRIIDIPGYEKIELHPKTRIIGTMNYGYAGTRELNEALVSRFLVVDMPQLTEESLRRILLRETAVTEAHVDLLVRLFLDLQLKSLNGEISSKAVDVRGLFAATDLMKGGLAPRPALEMGLVNKSFDPYEKELITDIIESLLPPGTEGGFFFQ